MAEEGFGPYTYQNTIVINDLMPETDYIAEVRASTEDTGVEGISAYQGPWSPALHFTTVSETVPPKPVINLTGKVEGSTFEITWENANEREDDRWLMNFKDFMVRVWPLNEGGNVETFYTTSLRYILTVDMNEAIFGEAKPALFFEVSVRDQLDDPNTSEPVVIMLEIEPLEPPELIALGGIGNTTLGWSGGKGHFSRFDVYRNDEKIAELGQGTSTFNDSDTRPGVHEYFIRCYDPFGRYVDTNTVEADVDPYDADFIAPSEPYDLEYDDTVIDGTSDVKAILSWRGPTLNVEDGSYEDFEGFELRYKTAENDPWTFVRIVDDRTAPGEVQRFYSRHTIPQGVTVYWGVRAFDRHNNYSSWASMDTAPKSGIDNSIPSRPSKPIVAGNTLSIQVRHNLMDFDGRRLPPNVQKLEIHAGDSENFTTSDNTLLESVSVERLISVGGTLVWSAPYPVSRANQEVYIKVVAVTGYPMSSPSSDAAGPEFIKLIEDINIENATITDASVKNLGADKLIAGEGIISDLEVLSKLLIGSGGAIESGEPIPNSNPPRLRSTYSAPNRTGWRVSEQGIFLYDGEIDAAKMKIQDSANALEQGYSNFSYAQDWYDEHLSRSNSTNFSTSVSKEWSRYGNWSLKTVNTSGVNRYIYLSSNNTVYNTPVEDGYTYLFSAYVKNTGSSSVDVRIGYRRSGTTVVDAANRESGQTVMLAPGEMRRISKDYTMPGYQGGSSYIIVMLGMMNNGTVHWDGVQVERQVGSSKTPSSYKVGGITEISGGMITTGQIESDRWRSSNGNEGWRIGLKGDVKFNNGEFRGNVRADSGYLKNLTITGTLSMGSGKILASGPSGNSLEISSSGIKQFFNNQERVNIPSSGEPKFYGQITGGSIKIGSNAFQVDGSGELWMGGSGPTSSNTSFRVRPNGTLTAKGADIQGSITATSGSFTGNIYADNGRFGGNLSGTDMNVTGYLRLGSVTRYLRLDSTGMYSYGSGHKSLRINSDGTIEGGEISGTSITGSTTITGPTIQTSSSGTRAEMTSSTSSFFNFYDSGGRKRFYMGWSGSKLSLNTFGSLSGNIDVIGDKARVVSATGITDISGTGVRINATNSSGFVDLDGKLKLRTAMWHEDSGGEERVYFSGYNMYIRGSSLIIRNVSNTTTMEVHGNGNVDIPRGSLTVSGSKNARIIDPDDKDTAYNFAAVEFDNPGTIGTLINNIEMPPGREVRVPVSEHFPRLGSSPTVLVSPASEPQGSGPAPYGFVTGWDSSNPEIVVRGPIGLYNIVLLFVRSDAGTRDWVHTVNVPEETRRRRESPDAQ